MVDMDAVLSHWMWEWERQRRARDTKLRRAFTAADTDGDGGLSLHEFQELVRRVDKSGKRGDRIVMRMYKEALDYAEEKAREEGKEFAVGEDDETGLTPEAFAHIALKYDLI